jgi:hypothetical protein
MSSHWNVAGISFVVVMLLVVLTGAILEYRYEKRRRK